MAHFPDHVWADWTRGMSTGASSAELQSHLSSGCEECRAAREMWQAVAELGRRETSYEPPPEVSRRAMALFAQHRPKTPSSKLVHMAELLFDSFRSPLPAGIRNLERSTRHLSYRAGGFFVDVRIEEQGTSGVASVVGQLVQHPDEESMPLEGCAVLLTSGRTTLAETTTNRFGEFSFEMSTQHENHLAIGVGDDFAIVVPLGGRRAPS